MLTQIVRVTLYATVSDDACARSRTLETTVDVSVDESSKSRRRTTINASFFCPDPCEDLSCGPNAHCMLLNDAATCLCSNGYTGKPGLARGGCTDIDECVVNPCPPGAICNNEAGTFSCQCPSGTSGDPYSGGCKESELPHVCGPSTPCPAGEQCIKDEFVGSSVCICQRGYTRDRETGKCRDINECMELRDKPACGINAICKNLPGSYECQCPPGFNGNPFSLCEECNSIECQCQPPYKIVNGKCMLSGCSKGETCPSGAECITIAGGVSYCACPKGYSTRPDGSCQGNFPINFSCTRLGILIN